MRNLIAILILLCGTPAWPAIAAGAHWNVRSDGSDTNGGCFDPTVVAPGTDYSAQASAQVSYTDLVIGTTTTQLTSALNPFSSTSPGNCIYVSGGTGFTTGWYEVKSVSGVTATMDRAVGTAASTGGTGNLGGGFLTLGQSATNAVNSNIVYLKNGTYTLTSTPDFTASPVFMIGYNSTYGDNPLGSNRPLITTSTNSTPLLETVVATISYIQFTNTAATSAVGLYTATVTSGNLILLNCYASGFGGSTDGGAFIDSANSTHKYWGTVFLYGDEIASSGFGVNAGTASPVYSVGSYFHGNGTDIESAGFSLVGNIFAGSTGSYSVYASAGSPIYQLTNNTFYGAAGNAFQAANAADTLCFNSNVFYGNNRAIAGDSLGAYTPYCTGTNAFGANTNANTGWFTSPTAITLSANPFVNASGGNFALNTTAGGGALLAGYGYPTAYGTTTANAANVGAVQGTSGGGGSTASNFGWAR